jgi:hypothetical protein
MKKLLTPFLLALAGIGTAAGSAPAGTFGLFVRGHNCKCGLVVRQPNAFSPYPVISADGGLTPYTGPHALPWYCNPCTAYGPYSGNGPMVPMNYPSQGQEIAGEEYGDSEYSIPNPINVRELPAAPLPKGK